MDGPSFMRVYMCTIRVSFLGGGGGGGGAFAPPWHFQI